MTWFFTAVAVSVASSAYSTKQAKKAQKKARKQALEDEANARKAEVFAETEGQGIGDVGTVQLGTEDEVDDEELDEDNSATISI